MSREVLVVGINQYASSVLPDLESPSEDAEAIAQLLEQYSDFRTPRRLPLVQDTVNKVPRVGRKTSVTLAELEAALKLLFNPGENCAPDTALFFFSGHGLRRTDLLTGETEGFLALSDSDPESRPGFSLQRLRKLLEASPVKQQLVWIDCCYSGELLNFDEVNPGARGKARDRCFIAASRRDRIAYEEIDGTHGVLTAALLEALDPTCHPHGEVNNHDLMASVERKLKKALQQSLGSNSGSAIVLTRSRQIIEISTPKIKGCPYKGLHYFESTGDDPKLFFGRDALTDQLLEHLRNKNFLALLGASGSGKSSVLRAGLIHQLRQGERLSGSEDWRICIFNPGVHPFENLAAQFIPADLPEGEFERQKQQLADSLRQNGPAELKWQIDTIAAESRLLLCIDQFEEIFTYPHSDDERQRFFECLLENVLNSPRFTLVLAMRADFFGKCAEQEYAGLSRLIEQHLITVTPMNLEELRQAICQPAELAGITLEAELVTHILADVQESPGSLPLLQDTLAELWKTCPDRKFTLPAYQKLGELKGALAHRADTVYSEWLAEQEQQNIARRIFQELVNLEEGNEYTRRTVQLQRLTSVGYGEEQVKNVVATLADARLIMTDLSDTHRHDNRGEEVEHHETNIDYASDCVIDLVHEALISHWPRYKKWIDANQDDIRFHRRLQNAAQHWNAHQKAPGLLWRSPDLEQLERFQDRHQPEMRALEIEFFKASKKQQQKEQVQTKTLHAAQQARLKFQKRANRFLIALSTLLILLVVLIFRYANQQVENANEQKALQKQTLQEKQRADEQRDTALRTQSLFLADLARQKNEKQDYGTALLLAMEALPESMDTPDRPYIEEAELQLYHAMVNLRERKVIAGQQKGEYTIKLSPDKTRMLMFPSSSMRWGNENFQEEFVVRVWDIATSVQKLFVLEGHSAWIESAIFSPDSSKVATAAQNGEVKIWSMDNGEELLSLIGQAWPVKAVKFLNNGSRLLTFSSDGTIKLWNTLNGKELKELSISPFNAQYGIQSAEFNSDGSKIMIHLGHNTNARTAESVSTNLQIWDIKANNKQLAVLPGQMFDGLETTIRMAITSLKFKQNGSLITIASKDDTAYVWDAINGNEFATLVGHTGEVESVTYSADGKLLATASADRTAKIWNAVTGKEIVTLRGHTGGLNSVEFNLDATRIITTSSDGDARVWDTTSGGIIAILAGHTAPVSFATFRKDGKGVITVSQDGTTRVWDLGIHDFAAFRLGGSLRTFAFATFNANGAEIIAISGDSIMSIGGAKIDQKIATFAGSTDPVASVRLSPDAERIITIDEKGIPSVWDVKNGTEIIVLGGYAGIARSAAFLQNGIRLVTQESDRGTLHVWDIKASDAPDRGTLHVWDIKASDAPELLCSSDSKEYFVGELSRDGKWMVVRVDDSVQVWNTNSCQKQATLTENYDWGLGLLSANFSRDGKRVITKTWESTGRVWDVMTGELLTKLEGHRVWINSACFNQDGTQIVTVDDLALRVWDIATGKIIAQLPSKIFGPEFFFTSVDLSPDGKEIVVTSYDGRVRTCPLFHHTQELIDYARLTAPRKLTPEERKQYFLE